jgi:hypothetical protein
MQEPPYRNDNPYGSSSQENSTQYSNPSGQNYGTPNQSYGSPSGQNYNDPNQSYSNPSGQNYGNPNQSYGNPAGQNYNDPNQTYSNPAGQNYGNQPYGYGSPVQPVAQSNGVAIAALIVGIISVVVCWIPFFGLVPPIVGIILGIIGRRKPVQQGISLAGLVLSIVGLVGALVITLLLVAGIIAAANSQS